MREGPTEYVCEGKMDVKSTRIPYMASDGSCFMITWIVFKSHFLEVKPNMKPGHRSNPKAHNRLLILFYHV